MTTARDSEVLAFLGSPLVPDERIERARKTLAAFERELESFAEPKFPDLVNRRILASTSLSRKLQEREEWDRANAFVAQAIQEDRPLTLTSLQDLNARLTNSQGEFRQVSVFGCDEEYLTPAAFEDAFAIFERLNSEEDVVLRAANLYIFTINVHPFLNGNGRTARLAADWVLLNNGFPALCFQTSIQSHVAYAQAGRYLSKNECVLKVYAALCNSYEVLLGRV